MSREKNETLMADDCLRRAADVSFSPGTARDTQREMRDGARLEQHTSRRSTRILVLEVFSKKVQQRPTKLEPTAHEPETAFRTT